MNVRRFTLFLCSLIIANISFGQNVEVAEQLEAPVTEITFENSSYDFGKMKSNHVVSHIYKFTNTGKHPLIIENAKPSCGCTVPFFPKVPILPGESSEIEVEFDTKGKQGVQSKTVTIIANTEPKMTILGFKGEVLPPEEETDSEAEKALASEKIKTQEAIENVSPNCFALYPNPTNDVLQLELKDHIGMSAIVEIYNEKGQKITTKKIERISRESTQFNVSTYAAGIYTITIRVENLKPMAQCFIVRK